MDFKKYSGTGNDFVLLDNREFIFSPEDKELIRHLCCRKSGIGSDGVILLEPPQSGGDFRMRIFNADGSEAEMCGNGIRCLFRFLADLGFEQKPYSIETMAGIKKGHYEGDLIAIEMGTPLDLELGLSLEGQMVQFIDTGVPHAVLFVENLQIETCRELGRTFRHHPRFQPKGTNVTFVQEIGKNAVKFCTYERGVEDFTLSCGTGATAAALIYSFVKHITPPVHVYTLQGELITISFKREGIDFSHVVMKGPASLLFEGDLSTMLAKT